MTPGARTVLVCAPIAVVALVYLAAFAWMPKDGFFVNDNGLKFLQVQALERSQLRDAAIPWPGRGLDPELRFVPLRPPFARMLDGRLLVSYGPAFAALSLPAYRALGFAGLTVLPLLGGLWIAWLAGGLAARACPEPALRARARALAVLGVGLATPVVFYALTFWEHAPALALSCAALVCGLDALERPGAARAVGCGALAALAVPLRPDAYLLSAVLGGVLALHAPSRIRFGLAFGAGLLLVLAPLWTFQWATSGSPLGSHVLAQSWGELGLATWLGERAGTARSLLLNTHESPWLSALLAAPFFGVLLLRPLLSRDGRLRALPWAAGLAALAGAVALHGHASSERPMQWLLSANGLFAASPLVVLGLLPPPGGEGPASARRVRRVIGWVVGIHVGLYAALLPQLNARGMHWGCRFLLVAYPLLGALAAATAAVAWSRFAGRTGARASLVAVAAVSLAMQVYAVHLLHERKRFSSDFASAVAAAPGEAIATGIWFLPHDLARVFYERPVFLARGRRGEALGRRLEAAGIHSVVWIGPPSDPPAGRVVSDGPLGQVRVELRTLAPRELGSLP